MVKELTCDCGKPYEYTDGEVYACLDCCTWTDGKTVDALE